MVRIKYGNVETLAASAFSASLLNCADLSHPDDLKTSKANHENFGNPCEDFSVLLDGASVPLPLDSSDDNVGVWSESVADTSGDLATNPTITLEADEPYELPGLTLTFDLANGIYPYSVDVSWYLADEMVNSATYICTAAEVPVTGVGDCDKIVVVARGVNAPNTRLRIRGVTFGVEAGFDGSSVKSAQITQEISQISTTLPISTADIVILNTTGANYDFGERQPMEIYNDDTLVGCFYIDEATRVTKNQWKIRAQDAVFLLDATEFNGGVYFGYSSGDTVATVAASIFAAANLEYTIDESLASLYVNGHIPKTTCRKALQQLLFASGGYARTAYSNKVDLLVIGDSVRESIPLSGRVLQGTQSANTESDITEIALTYHTYYPASNEPSNLYEAKTALTEEMVEFSEPVDAGTLTLSGNGQILESSANHAVITCDKGEVLTGVQYAHKKTIKSVRNTKARTWNSNKKSITDATLVTIENVDEVLQRCYDYFVKNMTITSKVVEKNTVILPGEMYEIATEVYGTQTGINQKQSFSLHGGKIAKKIELK